MIIFRNSEYFTEKIKENTFIYSTKKFNKIGAKKEECLIKVVQGDF